MPARGCSDLFCFTRLEIKVFMSTWPVSRYFQVSVSPFSLCEMSDANCWFLSKKQKRTFACTLLRLSSKGITLINGDAYFDVNAYVRFAPGRYILSGAASSLSFRFRYCNDHGLLIYQDGDSGYFAVGVHSSMIYLEWKTSINIIEASSKTAVLKFFDLPSRTFWNKIDWSRLSALWWRDLLVTISSSSERRC